jgi:hypothetical protein
MNIDKFLGINATGNDLKKGELANMQNFKITDGYDVEKRNGYTAVLNTATTKPINGQWYGKIGSTYYHLFASNGHIYQNDGDGTVTDLGTLTDAPTNFFFFKDAVYIQNGTEYKKWTGTGVISDVTGHIPLIAVATLPAGGGTDYEGVNLLNNKRRQQFNGDGSATAYVLREQNISSIDYVYVGGALKTVTTHYTVNLTTGVVTFTAGNIPANGINNVEIYWTNNSKTEYFDGTGSQTVLQLEETGITSVDSILFSGSDIVGTTNLSHVGVVAITDIFTSTGAHGCVTGDKIQFNFNVASVLTANTDYYVTRISDTEFYLSLTRGGAYIDATVNSGTSASIVLRRYVSYTSNLTTGAITFITVPPTGSKNVCIRYTSTATGSTNVTKYTNSNLYGGKNDNRVFLYGGSNRTIFSGLADGIPSAEYFPALNFIGIGNDNENVTQLTTQYDRQVIMKEHSIYWCAYEYDTSLGVTFPTYPLNDNVGCTFLGTGQTIRNNPWFIYQKSIYEITSPYMRDERYVKYVSDKIQPLLDALTFTNVHTLDNEEEKEYWLCIGRNVFVWNHNLETWHRFYLADTVTSICKVGSAIVIGTTGGQLMTFDTSLTDNGTAINGYIETDWLDYGTPNRSKYMDYAWFTIKPHGNSLAVVSYAVDSTDEREVGRIQMTTNYEPRTRKLRVKAKKFNRIKLFIRNTEQSELTIEGISVPVSVANLTR